jgi:hypothetical protein
MSGDSIVSEDAAATRQLAEASKNLFRFPKCLSAFAHFHLKFPLGLYSGPLLCNGWPSRTSVKYSCFVFVTRQNLLCGAVGLALLFLTNFHSIRVHA